MNQFSSVSIRRIALGLLVSEAILFTGCSALQSEVANSATESLYAKSASSLTAEATSEVQEVEDCQGETPDFAAVKEALVTKLTELIANLEAVDTSSFDEARLKRHDEFLAKVKADLEVVNAATELSDEFKQIARRVWRPKRGGGPRGPGQCHGAVRERGLNRQCESIKSLLDRDDLSDALKAALEARYAEVCSS